MKNKPFYRCACCNEEFDSSEACRDHFNSSYHKVIAIPAWIRYLAKINPGSKCHVPEAPESCSPETTLSSVEGSFFCKAKNVRGINSEKIPSRE
jgi:hypothetical protein